MRYLAFLLVVLFTLNSCNKKNDHSSLLGSWTCEEWPEITSPSTYQVSILRDYASKDSNQYIISNFYKLGLDQQFEVHFYEAKNGDLIIYQQTVGSISVIGAGTYSPDFSKIEWDYEVNTGSLNEKVKANYY